MVRQIAVGVLASLVPFGARTLAGGTDCQQKKIIVKATAGEHGDGQTKKIVKVIAGGEGDDVVLAMGGEGEEGDGRSEHRVVRVIKNDPADAERGWLGVSIGDVPESLAAQLRLEGKGVMVLNVAKDSPADQAGIAVHDIFLSMNGEAIDGDVGRAVELIKSRKPGDVINVTVLRDGQQKTSRVTLGSRADMSQDGFAWKFEGAPGAQIEDKVETRGRIMLRGPGGKWQMKDLGKLHDLKDLPADVLQFIPKSGSRSITIHADGKRIEIKSDQDGNALSIEQEGDGAIEVTRTDANNQETTKTYANADELRQGDPEAYELYAHVDEAADAHRGPGGTHTFNFNWNGDEDFDFDVDVDFDDDALRGEVEESLNAARDSYTKSMEELHRILLEMHSQHGDGQNGGAPAPHVFMHRMGKPRHTFEVRTDGTIEVRIRKGDSELVQLYRDANDLARRNPELSEKYQDLMNAGDE